MKVSDAMHPHPTEAYALFQMRTINLSYPLCLLGLLTFQPSDKESQEAFQTQCQDKI